MSAIIAHHAINAFVPLHANCRLRLTENLILKISYEILPLIEIRAKNTPLLAADSFIKEEYKGIFGV